MLLDPSHLQHLQMCSAADEAVRHSGRPGAPCRAPHQHHPGVLRRLQQAVRLQRVDLLPLPAGLRQRLPELHRHVRLPAVQRVAWLTCTLLPRQA